MASPMWSFECYDPHNRFYHEDLFSVPTFNEKAKIKDNKLRQSEKWFLLIIQKITGKFYFKRSHIYIK